MTPETHDRIFAAVSHLPHVLAYALVDAMAKTPEAMKNSVLWALAPETSRALRLQAP
ncbi:MAG: prephenate dehydrogenase dimerization domain-containing protein [Duodenibacillus massiliensis]